MADYKNNNKTIENKKINRRKVDRHDKRNVFQDTTVFAQSSNTYFGSRKLLKPFVIFTDAGKK